MVESRGEALIARTELFGESDGLFVALYRFVVAALGIGYEACMHGGVQFLGSAQFAVAEGSVCLLRLLRAGDGGPEKKGEADGQAAANGGTHGSPSERNQSLGIGLVAEYGVWERGFG